MGHFSFPTPLRFPAGRCSSVDRHTSRNSSVVHSHSVKVKNQPEQSYVREAACAFLSVPRLLSEQKDHWDDSKRRETLRLSFPGVVALSPGRRCARRYRRPNLYRANTDTAGINFIGLAASIRRARGSWKKKNSTQSLLREQWNSFAIQLARMYLSDSTRKDENGSSD